MPKYALIGDRTVRLESIVDFRYGGSAAISYILRNSSQEYIYWFNTKKEAKECYDTISKLLLDMK